MATHLSSDQTWCCCHCHVIFLKVNCVRTRPSGLPFFIFTYESDLDWRLANSLRVMSVSSRCNNTRTRSCLLHALTHGWIIIEVPYLSHQVSLNQLGSGKGEGEQRVRQWEGGSTLILRNEAHLHLNKVQRSVESRVWVRWGGGVMGS